LESRIGRTEVRARANTPLPILGKPLSNLDACSLHDLSLSDHSHARKQDVGSWMMKGTNLHNRFTRALFFNDILLLEFQPRHIILIEPIQSGVAEQYQRN